MDNATNWNNDVSAAVEAVAEARSGPDDKQREEVSFVVLTIVLAVPFHGMAILEIGDNSPYCFAATDVFPCVRILREVKDPLPLKDGDDPLFDDQS